MTDEEYDNCKWLLDEEDEVSFATQSTAEEFWNLVTERDKEYKYIIVRDYSCFGNWLVQKDYKDN